MENNDISKQAELQEREDLARVPDDVIQRMARLLRHDLATETKQQCKDAQHDDPKNWMTPYHLFFGITVRNVLRRGGFTEEALGIHNLDNIYIKALEIAIK